MATVQLQLDGLHCGHCVNSVEKALLALGVQSVQVDLNTQRATIESELPTQALIDAINDIGFDATL